MGRTNDRTPTLLAEAARKIQLHFEFIITVSSTIGLSALSLLFTAIPIPRLSLRALVNITPFDRARKLVWQTKANRDTETEGRTDGGRGGGRRGLICEFATPTK